MKIEEMGEFIVAYREKKGSASATDLVETVKGVRGKADELEQAIASGGKPEQKKALVDLLVWTIGGLGVIGADEVWDALEARVQENATRTLSSEAAKS